LKSGQCEQDEGEDLTAEANSYQINENYKLCCQSQVESVFVSQVRKLDEFVLNEIDCHPDLYLDKETFFKSINLIDIVSVDSTRSNCFTKKLAECFFLIQFMFCVNMLIFCSSYGRYLDGTGSVLRVKKSRTLDELSPRDNKIEIKRKSIRFFSPKEIANLHCFPNEFGKHLNLL
jgi:hypothetical protein